MIKNSSDVKNNLIILFMIFNRNFKQDYLFLKENLQKSKEIKCIYGVSNYIIYDKRHFYI